MRRASGQPKPPLFVLLFFSIFGFIGIGVLVFMWGVDDGFGRPPLIFKIFGSLIALGFMALGFGMPLSVIKKAKLATPRDGEGGEASGKGGYDCPGCGANVQGAEVSPSGDVKCPYCMQWWNIHRG